jgi:hypothetical protein
MLFFVPAMVAQERDERNTRAKVGRVPIACPLSISTETLTVSLPLSRIYAVCAGRTGICDE